MVGIAIKYHDMTTGENLSTRFFFLSGTIFVHPRGEKYRKEGKNAVSCIMPAGHTDHGLIRLGYSRNCFEFLFRDGGKCAILPLLSDHLSFHVSWILLYYFCLRPTFI